MVAFKAGKKILLERLEEVAQKLGVTVTYESGVEGSGGLCRLKDETYIIINKNLQLSDKIDLVAECLMSFNLDEFYIIPEVRDFLEWHNQKRT